MRFFIPMGNALVGPFDTEQAGRAWWCDHELSCAGGVERVHLPEDQFPGVVTRETISSPVSTLPHHRALSPKDMEEAAQNPDNLQGFEGPGEPGDLKPVVTLPDGQIVSVAYNPAELNRARRLVHAKALLVAIVAFAIVFAASVSDPTERWPAAMFILIPLAAYGLAWAALRLPV